MATQNPNRLGTNCPGGSLTLGGDTTVSRLGFGAMRLCGPGVWGEPLDLPGAKRVLMRAVELGITLVGLGFRRAGNARTERLVQ